MLAGSRGQKEKVIVLILRRQTQAEHENVLGALKEIEALPREVSSTVRRNSP